MIVPYLGGNDEKREAVLKGVRELMKIVVAMKQIPDLQQIRIRDRKPILDGVPLTFGKIDKNALEAAVQIKEAVNGEVVVVSVGNEELEDTIKEALAADADSSVMLIEDDIEKMDSAQTAKVLAELIKQVERYDLVIFGEGSGDNYSGQMGSRVAEILGLPQAGYVTSIEIDGIAAIVKRSLEDQEEILEVKLPAVISVAADLNEPRIPSVSKVLKAGKKPKEIFNLDDLDIEVCEALVATSSSLAPASNRKGIELKSVSELVEVLKSEASGGN